MSPAGPVAARCATDDAVAPKVRTLIEARARDLLDALREGNDDALWAALHPQARREDQRAAFVGALAAMRDRLRGASADVRVERVDVVDMRGGANALAMVECGAAEDPGRFTLMANAGGENVAVISLASEAEGTRFGTTVQLRQRGDTWRLVGIHVSPRTYRGEDAAAFERHAEVHRSQQRTVVAHALLSVAQQLSDHGGSIKTDLHDRVSQAIAALERDPLFKAETGAWTLGRDRFDIQGVSLAVAARDFSPVFEYVSPQGLVRDLLDRDADLLIEEVRRRFAPLSEHFDAVIFEAYKEIPDAPRQRYDAYRLVRYLDPARARD